MLEVVEVEIITAAPVREVKEEEVTVIATEMELLALLTQEVVEVEVEHQLNPNVLPVAVVLEL